MGSVPVGFRPSRRPVRPRGIPTLAETCPAMRDSDSRKKTGVSFFFLAGPRDSDPRGNLSGHAGFRPPRKIGGQKIWLWRALGPGSSRSGGSQNISDPSEISLVGEILAGHEYSRPSTRITRIGGLSGRAARMDRQPAAAISISFFFLNQFAARDSVPGNEVQPGGHSKQELFRHPFE